MILFNLTIFFNGEKSNCTTNLTICPHVVYLLGRFLCMSDWSRCTLIDMINERRLKYYENDAPTEDERILLIMTFHQSISLLKIFNRFGKFQ